MSLGGGLGECSSSTIDIPDFDLNVCWNLDEEVLTFLRFVPINDSGFYKIEINDVTENNKSFQTVFQPYVNSIQTHGAGIFGGVAQRIGKIDYFVKGNDDKIYLNSNLMRDQMDGLKSDNASRSEFEGHIWLDYLFQANEEW